MTQPGLERRLVDLLSARLPRSPRQLNATHESDAELVRLDGVRYGDVGADGSSPILAVTIDSIEEEIAAGLYTDPFMIGWVAVMASLSDLAAAGASPVGIVMSETLPRDCSDQLVLDLQDGIRQACLASDTFMLGGDTNFGPAIRLTGCAIGMVAGRPLRRTGIMPGDVLYSTGPLGAGNAFALARLLGDAEVPPYRPVARLREGRILSGIASACMDSSDGLFTTLRELVRLNRLGLELDAGWDSWLDRDAGNASSTKGVPPWLFLAGEHGEYELIFSVRPPDAPRLVALTAAAGRPPLRLGVFTSDPGVRVWVGDRLAAVDLPRILDIVEGARADPASCIHALLDVHDNFMTETAHGRDRARLPVDDIPV
jgi:thiamine-monophosphate kinase